MEDGDEAVTKAVHGSGELGGGAGGRGLGQDLNLADGDGALNVDDNAVDAGVEAGDQHFLNSDVAVTVGVDAGVVVAVPPIST